MGIALITNNLLTDSGVPITYSTSGTSGIAGSSGTSGANGIAGSSGTSGTRGTSGTTGTSGTSGSSGTGFNTITNPVDNRILTSLGTTNTANAEANLTFDGTNLINASTGGIFGFGLESFKQNGSLTNVVIPSDTSQIAQSPISPYLWHDVFAFGLYSPQYQTSANGTTYNAATLNNTLFAQKQNQNIEIINGTTIVSARWIWTGVAFNTASWLCIGFTYTGIFSTKTIVFESSADNVNWTVRHTSSNSYDSVPAWFYITTFGGDNYARLTITTTNATAVRISAIRLLTARWGDQGLGSEVEFPYAWDGNKNIAIGTSTIRRLLTVNGKVYIGSTTDIQPGGSTHTMDIIASGTDSALALVAGSGNLELWKDTTGANAVAVGMAIPGQTITNNFNISTYISGTWSQRLAIVSSNGNVLIGTNTDGGFKLDVNGTARVQGALTLTGALTGTSATFTGDIKTTGANAEIIVNGAGSSNSVGGSARFTILDSTNNRGWILQQDATYDLNFWHFNGGWTSVMNISPIGSISVTGESTYIGADTQAVPRLGFAKIGGQGPFLGFAQDPFTIKVSSGTTIATSNTFTNVLSIATTGAATFSSTVLATASSTSAPSTGNGIYLGYGSSSNNFNGITFQGILVTDMYFGRGVSSDDLVIRSNSGEKIRFTTSGGATFSGLAGTGSRTVLADASGVLSAPVSDISVKQNVTSIGYGLKEISKMNPVWFDFIDEYKNYGEGRQNGNIAQEMVKIIPEAVFITPSTGKMGINYDQLHAVYIKAIQELKAEIEELKIK